MNRSKGQIRKAKVERRMLRKALERARRDRLNYRRAVRAEIKTQIRILAAALDITLADLERAAEMAFNADKTQTAGDVLRTMSILTSKGAQ